MAGCRQQQCGMRYSQLTTPVTCVVSNWSHTVVRVVQQTDAGVPLQPHTTHNTHLTTHTSHPHHTHPLLCADCHHLQEQFLQQIFKHALHCARQFAAEATSAAHGSPAAAASAAAAAAAMKLMTSVLAWDFKATNSSLGFMSASLAGLTAAMVRLWEQYRHTQQHLRVYTRRVLVGLPFQGYWAVDGKRKDTAPLKAMHSMLSRASTILSMRHSKECYRLLVRCMRCACQRSCPSLLA